MSRPFPVPEGRSASIRTITGHSNARSGVRSGPAGAVRRGYFIGDGTGCGKGRQVAGIVMDNWIKGRRKAVWISKSTARRNFKLSRAAVLAERRGLCAA